jgi:general secretion pathway protein A
VETRPLPPSIEEWLTATPKSLQRDALLDELLAIWSVDAAGTPPCDAARAAGLRCLSGDGDWQRLSSLGLPVVLQLNAGDSHPHYALLQHLDDERLSLRIGGQSVDYWLNELEGAWRGRFITLWRPPAEVRRSLFPGNRGTDVAWVHRALNRIDEVVQRVPDRDHFGGALQSRVKAFQQQHGLTADGIIGEKTLIHLSAAVPDDDQPRLTPLPLPPAPDS